ncbi:hypothetical protein XBP1_1780003 [Xenorhabdus bovienii str. puntauvense]|uniref:Uncharacterized protein n=1 Tax=Xenorhabdus bovienii str. puntauvense TaxID=1398201 RepID=A0A077NCQ6_XENBV|nr:hypothetical protein XBP1_1780003 [Xenorhabdus bovienii str. puntauvense]
MIKRLLKLKTMALISGFGITILAERWLNNQNKIMGVFLISIPNKFRIAVRCGK